MLDLKYATFILQSIADGVKKVAQRYEVRHGAVKSCNPFSPASYRKRKGPRRPCEHPPGAVSLGLNLQARLKGRDMMIGKAIVWTILIGVFLLSGYGLNLIRVAIVDKMADPDAVIWWRVLLGAILMAGGISFLGGFIYHRDKKRGKIKPPAWKTKS
jgi:hypothetical protein